MKRRKKPTALIVALFFFAMLAFGLQGAQSGMFRDIQKMAQPAVSAERQNDTSSTDFGKQAKAALGDLGKAKKDEKAEGKKAAAAAMRQKMGGVPMMATPKAGSFKAKPNDSSIGTQWYTDESRTYN